MLKALFKKQLMEVNTWLFLDKKSGKRRSAAGIAALAVLYAVIFIILGGVFFSVAVMLCGPLVSAGLGWLYFAIMGLISVMLGVFGSVFNTYATLYQAKDNSLLLALPVPPRMILAVRLLGVWLWSFIYSAIVFVPALIAYWITAPALGVFSVLAVPFGILTLILLSLFILILACILGWVVAKISAKLKNKSIVTVILSLAFFALYYYIYFKANAMLQSILANVESVSRTVKGALYPLYLMGRAAEGNILPMLLFTLMTAALFALTYFIMSRSFLKMAAAKSAAEGGRSKKAEIKIRSVGGTLFYKEVKRFFASPTYMLNCGLGTFLLPAAAVLLIIKGGAVVSLFSQFDGAAPFIPLIACAALCAISSMNDITAPSVSLEGKNLWLLQALPVHPWQVLKAKLYLHLVFTEPPVLICAGCAVAVLRPSPLAAVLIFAMPSLFVLLSAVFGLAVNLKSPNLSWTNETVPVKQSMGVFLSLFGGWVFIILLGVLYFLLSSFVSPEVYILICACVTGGIAAILLHWLKTKGTKIFSAL